MIWGSQYDAMLRWIANGDDAKIKTLPSKHNNTHKNGAVSTDILNNVYDLFGNSWEWTLEGYGAYDRTIRGGCYTDVNIPVFRCKYSCAPTVGSPYYGSRITLYIL